MLAATLLDLAAGAGDAGAPSWVLLAAPVLPLLGVAASWSRALDPAHELVAATPAAGLPLLLWRTLVVLAVVVPAALVAGVVTGADGPGDLAAALPRADRRGARARQRHGHGARDVRGRRRVGGRRRGARRSRRRRCPRRSSRRWLPAWGALTIVAAGVIALRRNAYRRLLEG